MTTYLTEEVLKEAKPIVKENTKTEKAKRYVFKIVGKPGSKFKCEFYDGSSCELTVNENNMGKYAFVAKGSCRILKLWDHNPSEEEALQVLRRAKAHS